MPNYVRPRIAGGTWFFTVNLLDRNSRLLTEHIDALRKATRKTKQRFPFRIDALVVLPNHLHAVWTLPENETDFSLRWRLIKIYFAKSLPRTEYRSRGRIAKGERGIWQRRFWEHTVRDDEDYQRHLDYCYINPVKHGLVRAVRDWPYSSFHRDVRAGLYPPDWGGDVDERVAYGER